MICMEFFLPIAPFYEFVGVYTFVQCSKRSTRLPRSKGSSEHCNLSIHIGWQFHATGRRQLKLINV